MALLSAATALILVSGLAAAAPKGPRASTADPRNAAGSSAVKPAASGPSILSTAGAVITNGTLTLGLFGESHLNYGGVGLKYNVTGNESLRDGCYCEGWGIADTVSSVSGYANESTDRGAHNMTVTDFSSTGSTATSVVRVGSTFEVTHNWHPSSSANLYEGTVTVRNISGAAVNAVYRRVMDWDIAPSVFSEYVTIKGTTDVIQANNNGFNSANPLAPTTSFGATGEFTDFGPYDHGAMFDFRVGTLNPGESKQFKIYYGAASNESSALAALTAVGAQVYSLGQPASAPTTGEPNTFMFGYSQGCAPGLNFTAPLSTSAPYTMGQNDSVDIRFTWGGNGCALDDSVSLVVRDNANARIRYVAHVLNHDLLYNATTHEYSVQFRPSKYGVPAPSTVRADVYFGGTRVGYTVINVTP
jgi:hypothetical protein